VWQALILLLLLILILISVEILRISLNGWRAKQLSKKAIAAENKPHNISCKVLVVGDSTARGVGASHQSKSIIGLLAKDFPEFFIVNQSQDALDAKGLESILQARQTESFDYVLIHIGGMDALRLTPLQSFSKQLQQSLILANNIASQKVFLISVNNIGTAKFFSPFLRPIFSRRSKQIAQTCDAECQKQNVRHVSLYAESTIDPLGASESMFAEDKIHPSDAGYAIWYGQLKEAMIEYVATK
jgi:lysophospholipase L1-like esterase